jgi:tetratricopeptide (TPR) repeat protein
VRVPSRKSNVRQPALPRRDLWIYLGLLLVILAVYGPVGTHDFLNYDDPAYVTDNPHVRDGITWRGIAWAFTSTDEANWFPLTRLSHMLDCQLFGLSSGPHHLVNVVLHTLSSLLLFAILRRMTKARWPSAFVALAFALHPLHVESVAWVAERKDVLSALFWFLTMWAYLNYVERPTLGRYLPVVAWFICGLMSKPMVVTLPFALLLVDFWPLQRLKPVGRALVEKISLFLFSAIASVVTYVVQSRGGAVAIAEYLPLLARLENALLAYTVYIEKFIWPTNLAVFYPYTESPVWEWVFGGAVVSALTALAIHQRQRMPFLAFGWFWYLGTLLPVIGLVQVGSQSRADRYTYIPMVGISIMVAWGARELIKSDRALAAAGITTGLIWCGFTWRYLEDWESSETLFLHALQATDKNFVAYNNLGSIRQRQGRIEEAVSDFEKAVKIQPGSPEALDSLGEALTTLGKSDEAIADLLAATRIRPTFVKAHIDLGSALMSAGRVEQSAAQFQEALRLDPASSDAEYRLAGALMNEGLPQEALPHFRNALPALVDTVRRNPDDADSHYNLGEVYAMMGRPAEAVSEFSLAVRLRPDDPEAHFNLGLALSDENRLTEASHQFVSATKLRPEYVKAHLYLARTLVKIGSKSEAAAEYSEVLRLAPGLEQARKELGSLNSP